MKKLYTLLLLAGSALTAMAQTGGAGFLDGWKRPTAAVNAIAVSGDTAYIGGDFTEVGYLQAATASFSTTTGNLDAANTTFSGSAYAAASDGTGGWYVGGSFNAVNGLTQNRLVHILANGTVDPAWSPVVNNTVTDMLRIGNTVYISGYFTTVGFSARNGLAAINAATGAVSAWNPAPAGNPLNTAAVKTIATDGTSIYAGGAFTNMGGQPRAGLAAINASSGAVTGWNPGQDGSVNALAVTGTTVYVGGQFSTLGGQYRNNIGAVDAATGLATAYDPDANSIVYDVAVGSNTIYLGGDFTTIGNQLRNHLAATDATIGAPASWNPNASGAVITVAVSGSTIYVGGQFTNIGTTYRSGVAAIDATTGALTSWAPDPHSSGAGFASITTLVAEGNQLYMCGNFEIVFAEARSHLAAYKLSTGALLPWAPIADATVQNMIVSGNNVFFTGYFNTVNGTSRTKSAAVDKSGALRPWDPAYFYPYCITAIGSHIYAGISNSPYFVEVDSTAGLPTAWAPVFSNKVYAIEASGNTLYVGGNFTTVDGQPRSSLAAFDLTTHALTAWDPNVQGTIYTLAIGANNVVYAGGSFYSVGGLTRHNAAGIGIATGLPTSFNPNTNSIVNTLAINGNTIYAGGAFSTIGGQSRNALASLNGSNGLAAPLNAGMAQYDQIKSLALWGNTILAGGSFYAAGNNVSRSYFIGITDTAALGAIINIAATNMTICSGTSVTFTSTAYNGGVAPAYQWLKNGTAIANATSATYTTAAIANGDVFSAVLTSSNPGNAVDTSNTVAINVLSSATWTGNGANDNWSNTANWSCGAVPTATTDVVIPTGATVIIDIPNAAANNLTVSCCTNVSFSGAGNSLHVAGSMSNSGAVNATGGTLQVDNP